jgi:hypothetical protein
MSVLVQLLNSGKLWAFCGEDETVKKIPSLEELLKGRLFERDTIVLCVRWCSRYKLGYRDLVEMIAERGLSLAHTTIMRWVQRFTPAFEKCWNRYAPEKFVIEPIGAYKENEALHDEQNFKVGSFVPKLGIEWPVGLVLTCEHIAELLGGCPRV